MSKRQPPPKPAPRPSPAHEPAPPPANEIPRGLEADFAPLHPHDKPIRGDESDPYHRDSLLAQREFDAAAQAATDGREDEAVRRFLTASKLAERAHEWYLAALSFRRVGDFLLNPKPPCDLDRALRMYRRAVDAYERCGLVDEARDLTYYELRLVTARGREMNLSFWRRAELWLYWAVAGYGLRPMRVVGAGASIVLLFGILYWLLGGVVEASTRAPAGLWECIYFSGITFATVGYGDFLPTPGLRPLALLEGALGALTMGFFVVVLANRLRR
jgi:Ion channel